MRHMRIADKESTVEHYSVGYSTQVIDRERYGTVWGRVGWVGVGWGQVMSQSIAIDCNDSLCIQKK
jgi:hypothetical protein